jgi:hypothetical protein
MTATCRRTQRRAKQCYLVGGRRQLLLHQSQQRLGVRLEGSCPVGATTTVYEVSGEHER